MNTDIDPGLIARIDQLHATALENMAFVIQRAAEAKQAGWDYPAIAVLIAYKLEADCPQFTRKDLALLAGAAAAKLLQIANIAEQVGHELHKQ